VEEGSASTLVCALDPGVVGGAYYADCAVSGYVHEMGMDEEAGKKLWDISEKMLAKTDKY
jgi:hypothetical protein